MSPEEENQYFRRLLNLHPTMPLGEQRERVLTEADKVMQRPLRSLLPGTIHYHEGPLPYCGVRWEYKVLTLPDLHANAVQCEAMLTPLGLEGWECFHVGGAAWMKRRLG